MLVIFGANGRTGIEVVREARHRGMPVRSIARSDRDVDQLNRVVPITDVCFANADHPNSLGPVLDGATRVISCIDPRTAGPNSPQYKRKAAANIVKAATIAGVEATLHVTVMGAFRWSRARLNRASFHLDEHVRCCTGPWGLLRVSCYIDEIIEAHVWPPDGGRPFPFLHSSRYAPITRQDAARAILDHVSGLTPGRAPCMGGPVAYSGEALNRLVAPRLRDSRKAPTAFRPVPPGDVSVEPETTRGTLGWIPSQTLESALDLPIPTASGKADPKPVYRALDPGPHSSDMARTTKVLSPLQITLRRVVHEQLADDLNRIMDHGGPLDLDFSRARTLGRRAAAHDGEMSEFSNVHALDKDGKLLHKGGVDFLRDSLAEEFHCWWKSDGIPSTVWHKLDMGVRRRLVNDEYFCSDSRVKAFASRLPEAV